MSFKQFLFVVLLVLISSVEIKSQTSDVSEGCFPLTVAFTPPPGYSQYYWDFGDGASSTIDSPSNTYLTAGVYNASFRETIGGNIIGTLTINVYDKPIPSFTTQNEKGCVPLNVSFTNTTTLSSGVVINDYNWIFSNGATSTGNNTNYVFSTPGVYNVSLSITTNFPSCNSNEQYINVVSVSTPPQINISTNPSPALSCTAPFNLDFQNSSTSSSGPLTYSWDFANGQTSVDETPPSQVYSTDGNYQVVLVATDTNSCSNTGVLNVGVGQPVADFTLDDTICINSLTTVMNNSPAGNYSWVFDAGSSIQNSTLTNPQISYSTSGFHDITLNILGACPADTTKTIYVEEVDPTFTSSPTFSCSSPMDVNFIPNNPSYNEYNWTFGNDSTSNIVTPSVTYLAEDTNIYAINGPDTNYYFTTTLVVTSLAGCVDSFSLIDTLHEPNSRIIPNLVEGCYPLNVSFTDSSSSFSNITNWEWNFGDGTVVNALNNSNQTHTYTNVGEYQAFLIITNENGCTDTSYSVLISVGDQINIDFDASPTVTCLGEQINFTDLTTHPLADSIDSWHYYIEDGRMFSCFDQQNPSWNINHETGLQDVTMVVGFNGCYSELTKNDLIDVKGPLAKFTYENECETPLLVNFINESEDYTSLSWDFGDGNSSTTTNPIHTYSSSGDYVVNLIAQNNLTGCVDDTFTMTIKVRVVEAGFSSDSILCKGVDYNFDANASTDVFESCYRGYTWYFSDPNMRPLMTASPSEPINFNLVGNNQITLIVRDENNCSDTAIQNVVVYGIESNFTMTEDTICLPNAVSFSELGVSDTTLTSWSWDFGDGNNTNVLNPTNTFTTSTNNTNTNDIDTIIVTLTIENILGCTADTSNMIYVYSPNSLINVNDNTICSGTEVNFTASDYTVGGSNLTFNWTFGDGSTSLIQNPNHTYTTGGTYNVLMSFTESGSGCQGSETLSLTVRDIPEANFSTPYDSSLYICPGENILMSNTTQTTGYTTYNWDFGNGSTSSFANPGAIFISNGSYTIQLIATNPYPYGCIDTIQKTYVVQGPSGDFVTDLGEDTICRLGSVNFNIIDTSAVDVYHWDFGDGTGVSNVSPVSHQYTFVPQSGSTIAKLIMTNADGSCPSTQDIPIHIYEVVANFDRNFNDIDTALCMQPYPFSNTSINADTYSWNFGDGSTSNSQNPNYHSYSQSGTYDVMLSVSNNQLSCTDTVIKQIVIHPLPDFYLIGDTICQGSIGDVTIDSNIISYDYLWSSNPVFSMSDSSLFFITDQPEVTTDYTLNVVDSNGCSNSQTAQIIVFPSFDVLNYDTTIVIGDTILLPLNLDPNLYSFVWSPEDGLSCTNCSNPSVAPLDDVEYVLTVSDNLGCFTDQAIYTVQIHPETFITLPTTFTPNGDGNNDVIYVEGWGIKELIEYKIFNRWGELIFETTDKNVGWNGYYKGVLQNNDVYVVQVKAITWKNEEKTLEGYINLMR